MNLQQLAVWRPVLHHILPKAAQASIAADGLRSAAALLNDAVQNRIVNFRWQGEQRWRPQTAHNLCGTLRVYDTQQPRVMMEVQLNNGIVSLRDQHALGGPNGLAALADVLDGGLTPEDWLRILNERVYFFPCQGPNGRGSGMSQAGQAFQQAYLGAQHLTVLTLETAKFPASLEQKIRVSTINGGAINGMARRGPNTYQTLHDFPAVEMDRIKEITILGHATVAELLPCCISPWFRAQAEVLA